MTEERDARKAALAAQKAELDTELKEIQQQEAKERDEAAFARIVRILDNGDVLLQLMDHSRTTCSDENPSNAYTTTGRGGGSFRCTKCGLMDAVEQWKAHREWLIALESGRTIEDQLNCYFGDIHIDVTTTVE